VSVIGQRHDARNGQVKLRGSQRAGFGRLIGQHLFRFLARCRRISLVQLEVMLEVLEILLLRTRQVVGRRKVRHRCVGIEGSVENVEQRAARDHQYEQNNGNPFSKTQNTH